MTDVGGAEFDLAFHCRKAAEGSSWFALLVAVNTKPKTLNDLMRIVGVRAGVEGFDACLDAWAVYADAREQGAADRLTQV